MEIMFLGTSSMFPTEKSSQPAVWVRIDYEQMLLDCGEGTQRQMRIAGKSLMKVNKIFITHWHGDHSIGLAGVIQSMAANKRKDDLIIYGPKGTAESIKHLIKAFKFDMRYKIKVVEISTQENKIQKILDNDKFKVEAMSVKHIVPCVAYSILEKGKRKINLEYTKKFGLIKDPILGRLQAGKTIYYKGQKITPKEGTILTPDKKLSYILDTAYFKGLNKLAKNSDILICEATFGEELNELSKEYAHMTSLDSAKLAKEAKVKQLILTHLSQRYEKNKEMILNEAKKIFENTKLAEDFMHLEIK